MATVDVEGDRLALTVKCPVCEASIGLVCVYVKPVPRADHRFYFSRERQAVRAGHPTKRPHNERRMLARMLEARRRSWKVLSTVPRERFEKIMNYRAYRWELEREQEQLRSWLARYGHIFTDAVS